MSQKENKTKENRQSKKIDIIGNRIIPYKYNKGR